MGPTYIFSQLTEGRCRRPLLTEGQLQKATSILSKRGKFWTICISQFTSSCSPRIYQSCLFSNKSMCHWFLSVSFHTSYCIKELILVELYMVSSSVQNWLLAIGVCVPFVTSEVLIFLMKNLHYENEWIFYYGWSNNWNYLLRFFFLHIMGRTDNTLHLDLYCFNWFYFTTQWSYLSE